MVLSEEMMGKLLEVIPEGLVVATPERRISQMNTRVCDMFGYEPKELIGKSTSILYANKQEYIKQGMTRFNPIEQTLKNPYTVNYRRKNGEVFPGETVGTVLRNGHGEITAFIGIIRDVTEQVQRKEDLEAYRRETKRRLREEVASIAQLRVDVDSRLFTATG